MAFWPIFPIFNHMCSFPTAETVSMFDVANAYFTCTLKKKNQNTSQTIVKLLFQPHLMFQSFLFVRYVSYTQSVKLYLSRETHK